MRLAADARLGWRWIRREEGSERARAKSGGRVADDEGDREGALEGEGGRVVERRTGYATGA